MHMGLVAIVYATGEEAAVKQGEKVFDILSCKTCQRPFDYYIVGGRGDWAKICRADSGDGKRILQEAMAYTKEGFLSNLEKLRVALQNKNNAEIWEQRYPERDDVRFFAHSVGQYTGSNVCVYDNDGEGVRDSGHLKDALEKWPNLKDRRLCKGLENAGDVWLVTADAHH